MRSLTQVAAVLILVGLVVSACGGSDGTGESAGDPAPAPPTEVDPVETDAPPAPPDPEPAPEPTPEPPEPAPEPPEPAPADPPAEPPADPPAEPPAPSLPEGLPDDIAGYEGWIQLNTEPIPPIEGGDPHRGTKDVFTNLEADRAGGGPVYPDGTVIVKHATRPDRDFIGLIAIMRKIAGSDPANNDWEYIEYAREGPEDAFSILASGQVCLSCHMNASGTDYVWVHTTGAAP